MQIILENSIAIVTFSNDSVTEEALNSCLRKLLVWENYFGVVFKLDNVTSISVSAMKTFGFLIAETFGNVIFVGTSDTVKCIFKISGYYNEKCFCSDIHLARESINKKQENLYHETIKNTISGAITIFDQRDQSQKTLITGDDMSTKDSEYNKNTHCDDESQSALEKRWEKTISKIENINSTYKGERSLGLDFFSSDDEEKTNDTDSNDGVEEDRFSCGEEIARGGMGIVIHGYQNSLKRKVAIKKLIADLKNKDAKKNMFLCESIVTANLDHPNIIPVYDLNKQNEEAQLAMKFIEGTSWAEIIGEQSLEKNLQILCQVCNAISFAHSKGVIHCDLKPENIMIGQFGEVIVMDWGISVGISQSSFAPHKDCITNALGTPAYFAPELAKGKGVDIGPWTDIYLLGSILCEILTGNPPHREKNVLMTFLSAAQGKIPNFPKTVPNKLVEICQKSLNKQPEKRHDSVACFQREVEEFLQYQKSIWLTEQAQEIMNNANVTDVKIHDLLTEAYFGFQQALKLWDKNEVAVKGQRQVSLKHIQLALDKEEFSLAESLLQRLSDSNEEKTKLKEAIFMARNLQKGQKSSLDLFKFSLFFLCVVIIEFFIAPTLIKTEDIVLESLPLWICFTVCGFLGGFCYLFFKNKWEFNFVIQTSIFFQVIGCFLLFIGIFLTPFAKDFSIVGVFPPVLWVVFINILIPYTWKQALVSQILNLSILSITIFAFYINASLPPQKILGALVSQMVVICFVSVLLRIKKMNNALVAQ